VHSPAIHVAVRSRDAIASHDHHDQVQCAGLLTEEIVGRIVGCSGLRDLVIWLGLQSMNEVREKYGVVNEENRNVDSNNVFKSRVSSRFLDLGISLTKVSFVSIKSGRKTVYISGRIRTTPFANNCGHSSEHWRLFACCGQE
jgi:hypothetical protein